MNITYCGVLGEGEGLLKFPLSGLFRIGDDRGYTSALFSFNVTSVGSFDDHSIIGQQLETELVRYGTVCAYGIVGANVPVETVRAFQIVVAAVADTVRIVTLLEHDHVKRRLVALELEVGLVLVAD